MTSSSFPTLREASRPGGGREGLTERVKDERDIVVVCDTERGSKDSESVLDEGFNEILQFPTCSAFRDSTGRKKNLENFSPHVHSHEPHYFSLDLSP